MAATAPARPTKATWEQWVREGAPAPVPEDLVTRDELIDLLREFGDQMTTNELRYWEAKGALPRPVRRSHTGTVRALYPMWVIDLVPRVRDLRAQGVPLPEIGEQLRRQFAQEKTARRATLEDRLYWTAPATTIHPAAFGVDPNDPEALAAWETTAEAAHQALGHLNEDNAALVTLIDDLARRLQEATGVSVGSIDLVFRDNERRALSTMTRYPTNPDSATPLEAPS